MKKKFAVLLVLLMLFSTCLVSCGVKDKVDENNISENTESDVQEELKDRAEAEGVSVSEMQKMIKELTSMTAEKYGDTYENYVATLENEGRTPFDVFATAADYMGLTIKEYYDFEKEKPEMSAEDQEIMDGMSDAMSEIEGIDLSELEEQADQLEQDAKAMENADKTGNNVTNGDIINLVKYEVLEIMNEENYPENEFYGIEYTSKKEASEVLDYFNEFLEGTDDYFIMKSLPAGAIVSGTVNNSTLEMSCERDFENNITYIAVAYHGEVEKK